MDITDKDRAKNACKRKKNQDSKLEDLATNNKQKKLERQPSRRSLVRDRRSSYCDAIITDSESEMCQSIPNNIAPEDRLRMLLRLSFQTALSSSLNDLSKSIDVLEVKFAVKKSFASFLADANSQKALENAVTLSKPEVNFATKEDSKIKDYLDVSKDVINRLQKESIAWERVKEESTGLDAVKLDGGDNAQTKDNEGQYEIVLNKLKSNQQRLLLQMKDIANASKALIKVKEVAEVDLTKPTLELYTATSHNDRVKDLVGDMLT